MIELLTAKGAVKKCIMFEYAARIIWFVAWSPRRKFRSPRTSREWKWECSAVFMLVLSVSYLVVTHHSVRAITVMNVLLDEDATDKNVLAGCGVQEVSRDQQKAVYVLNWNLLPEMLPASKKNSRETIVLAFPMNLGEVRLKLQCKVYGEKSKKHQGGRRLYSIEQLFTINEQSLLDYSTQYTIT
ncbi:uncharacterized protein LOC142345673 isoform X1 [Convolutriloba macropyga]|uniref:uncharacterized protein LOC142345673 isoform X1 n=1 Tax=Convolutriloba macropyga TaxID=536237 RepID=UPI003F52647A